MIKNIRIKRLAETDRYRKSGKIKKNLPVAIRGNDNVKANSTITNKNEN
ncbi:MAG: hypothetical protein JXC36_04270 [Candidatus Atribacteria bacterium]|nr:hypothetical protein [Candidatus Atribacteria bacterium]